MTKSMKVEFLPGCFDNFEGTQEELDALQKEIIEMFSNMGLEELEEQLREIDLEELEEITGSPIPSEHTRNLH